MRANATHRPLLEPLLGRVTRNASWLLVGDVLIKGAMILISAVVARGMGPASLGVFSLSFGAVLVAVRLLTMGQVEVLIRETARTPPRTRLLLATSRRIQRWMIRCAVPAGLLALFFVKDQDLRITLLAFIPYLLLRVEILTRGAVFKGLDRMEVEVQARTAEMAVALVLVAACSLAGWPVWSTGFALSVGGAAGLGWLVRRLGELAPPEGSAPSAEFLLRQGVPFVGLAVALQLLLRSDMFLAAGLGISKEQIGYFGGAAAIVWGLLALPQLLAVAVYPTVSRLARHGASAPLSTLTAAGVGLALGSLTAGAVWVVRDPLLSMLFGTEFLVASDLLGRLLWALPGASASMVLGVVLASWHRQGRQLVLLSVILAASLGLNVLWIPRLGMMAAATVAVAVHSLGALGNAAFAAWPASPPAEDDDV